MTADDRGDIQEAIERQELLGEVFLSGTYQCVRISRVKYKRNPNALIDVRLFQRGYDKDGEEVYHPTKKGIHLLESKFQRLIGQWTIMPTACLHPRILDRSFPLLLEDDHESAVLQALKSVEVAVRDAAGLEATDVGVGLMRKAFDSNNGPLTDKTLPVPEREAVAHLFAGAIGFYKNPCSHRDVEINFIQGFETLMIASHLMKYVEQRIEAMNGR